MRKGKSCKQTQIVSKDIDENELNVDGNWEDTMIN
jgi:hypothetical protein